MILNQPCSNTTITRDLLYLKSVSVLDPTPKKETRLYLKRLHLRILNIMLFQAFLEY